MGIFFVIFFSKYLFTNFSRHSFKISFIDGEILPMLFKKISPKLLQKFWIFFQIIPQKFSHGFFQSWMNPGMNVIIFLDSFEYLLQKLLKKFYLGISWKNPQRFPTRILQKKIRISATEISSWISSEIFMTSFSFSSWNFPRFFQRVLSKNFHDFL